MKDQKKIPTAPEFLAEQDAKNMTVHFSLLLQYFDGMLDAGWERRNALEYLALYSVELGKGSRDG